MTQQKQVEVELKYAPRYNLQAVDTNNAEGVQALLTEGYEPFSVTSILVPVKVEQPKIATPGAAPQPFQMVPQTTIWFRQLVHVPITNEVGANQ